MNIFSKLFGHKSQEESDSQSNNSEVLDNPEDELIFDDPQSQVVRFKEPYVEECQTINEPKDIPEAIKFIVSTQGRNFLTNRGFINILNDFRLLKDNPAAKNILQSMLDEGYINRLITVNSWEVESLSICQQYVNEFGTRKDLVLFIIESFGYGLGYVNEKPLKKAENEPVISQNEKEPKPSIFEITGVFEEYDPKRDLEQYRYPTLSLIKSEDNTTNPFVNMEEQMANKTKIVELLRNYGIELASVRALVGHSCSLYELEPAPGTRISKIQKLEDEISLAFTPFSVRIIAPLINNGKVSVGIEIPNTYATPVSLENILESKVFQESSMILPCAIGKTISNETYIFDLQKAPQVLIAGGIGQGKSNCMHAMISSLLYKKHPAEIKLILIDQSKLNFGFYKSIDKHFLASLSDYEKEPIISDTVKVIKTFKALIKEMNTRYDLMVQAHVRNILEYNQKFVSRQLNPNHGHKYMPFIVTFIDEYSDYIISAGKEFLLPLLQLAQKGRAAGIHFVIGTFRPNDKIITDEIKANFSTMITLRANSSKDSMNILGRKDAVLLYRKGEMLCSKYGSDLIRIQGAFVDTQDILNICSYISQQQGYYSAYELPDPDIDKYTVIVDRDVDMTHLDPLFADAARLIVLNQSGSTSLIQRKFAIGYNRAGRLLDQLEKAGIVGPAKGSAPREMLVHEEVSLNKILSKYNL